MKSSLYKFILSNEQIDYAIFNSNFQLVETSDNLSLLFHGDRLIEPGNLIYDVFFELIGFEDTLSDIITGKKECLSIDWIGEAYPYSKNAVDNTQAVSYFNLRVLPFENGLVVILRNVTEEGDLDQTVYKRRNELDILSSQLIEDLKFSNQELKIAYKTTIEGWAKALELRDVETKGHSVRVVDFTLQLARNLGIPEEELDQYYYGALLHDIGKMGIPDRILLKEGALNEDEWSIMRLHPLYANRLLASIKHPHFSIDIPTYHHEKWDGSGYPFGLQGTAIPLAARIFSVVDVFDALISDRPYRKAWAVDDVIDYLKRESGLSFDPKVVKEFIKLLHSELSRSYLSTKTFSDINRALK